MSREDWTTLQDDVFRFLYASIDQGGTGKSVLLVAPDLLTQEGLDAAQVQAELAKAGAEIMVVSLSTADHETFKSEMASQGVVGDFFYCDEPFEVLVKREMVPFARNFDVVWTWMAGVGLATAGAWARMAAGAAKPGGIAVAFMTNPAGTLGWASWVATTEPPKDETLLGIARG